MQLLKSFYLCVFMSLFVVSCAGTSTVTPVGSSDEIKKETKLQRKMALERQLRDSSYIKNISYPILKANASLCPKKDYHAGMDLWNDTSIGEHFKPIAKELYGLDERVRVKNVFNGFPAIKSGIRQGDIILKVNDEKVPTGKKAIKKIQQLFAKVDTPFVQLTLERNGKKISKRLKRVKICDYGVSFQAGKEQINAYADGKAIYLTSGMLRFIETDTELALVIAHELAHNSMEHIKKKKTNAIGAGLGGLAVDILLATAGVNTGGAMSEAMMSAGGRAKSVDFEQEADYVGMYYMARSGYKTNKVADFWRRMATETQTGLKKRTTHPTSPERFIAIEKTHAEITKKKRTGVALLPNLKKDVKEEKG